ncbi:hypothetical protein LEP1GSC188_2770 [Leptospira weilii serovar Topaz str. LT2116]|uniref:Uncharacterized protein n=1 Tax=Leptospira weilii serovar Topaz str. LT2116 TaxID=1088540 RepID=M3FRF2_9LEPT|nr:hypothetical protein LEP1GSC188_2770 [Leptospira weilii serovar Topaz str. LT2116]
MDSSFFPNPNSKKLWRNKAAFLRDLFKSWETLPRTLAWKDLPQFSEPVFH